MRRRFFEFLAVCLLGSLCSLAALRQTPLSHIPWSPSKDVRTHTELVSAAAEAQAEGQWLLREAPRVAVVQDPVFIRYPIFQFYSVLPYGLGGLLVNGGLDPYHALLAVVLFTFIAGFVGAYYLAREWGLAWDGALACALVYTLAPYHLTDWYGRFAVPELLAFGLMPGVLGLAMRCRRTGRLGDVLGSCLLWSALILTHNIFHVFGLLFIAAVMLWPALGAEKNGLRSLRAPVAAYAMALLLCAWYLAPVALNGAHFVITGSTRGPFEYSLYAPLGILLSPTLKATAEVRKNSPLLGLQVGWLILGPALAGCVGRKPGGGSAKISAALPLFLAAFFLAWSPVDIWSHAGVLKIVQYPYRLLVFATLFGSLLAGEAWGKHLSPRLLARPKVLALALLILVGTLSAAPYSVAWVTPWPVDAPEKFYHELGLNLRGGYLYQYRPTDPRNGDPGVVPAAPKPFEGGAWDGLRFDREKVPPQGVLIKTGVVTEAYFPEVKEATVVLLPSPWYPSLYEARVNGEPWPTLRSADRLAVRIPKGSVRLQYRFTGSRIGNQISALAGAAFLGLLIIGLHRPWRRGTR